jgi:hypothetical protein
MNWEVGVEAGGSRRYLTVWCAVLVPGAEYGGGDALTEADGKGKRT